MIVDITTLNNNFFERTDTLVRFCEDIRKYTPLDIQREKELIEIYKTTTDKILKNKAKDELICANQRFVLSMARRWGSNDNLLDLISEGNVGILEALENYDLKQNVKFITFAVFYIRRAINNYLIKHGRTVKRSNLAKTFHLLSQATDKFLQTYERQPTNDELLEVLNKEYGVDIKDAHDVLPLYIQSIDGGFDDTEEHGEYELMEYNINSASVNDCEKNNETTFAKILTENLLKKLTPIEQEVIRYVFGINHCREYELQEIGEKLGYTSERIRQIKKTALEKMKVLYSQQINKI